MSDIHGREVDFGSHDDAKKHLRHDMRKSGSDPLFKKAEKGHDAYFYADGDRYKITYEKPGDGEKEGSFSVDKHSH
jgi:hypothetical protein